jgi:hypothetical protein
MDTRTIRKNCYQCGNRSLVLMNPGPMATDFCDHAQMECSKICYCHASVRIPKTRNARRKKAVEDAY